MTSSQFSPTPGEVQNPKGKSKGVKALVVDGKRLSCNLVPLPTDGRTSVTVEITLGS